MEKSEGSGSRDIGQRVLGFYEACPFNVFGAPTQASALIRSHNPIQPSYPDLHRLLSSQKIASLADIGCGGGWLSISAQKYYGVSACGIDFNPKVLAIARETARLSEANPEFVECDIFSLSKLQRKFELVCSIGVLHHTFNTQAALVEVLALLGASVSARLYLGLYHLYGRRPFLQYFETLRANGHDDDALFKAYRELHAGLSDEQHLRSWFRDQVLHPHETQHTLEEVNDWLQAQGLEVETTSINNFASFADIHDLFPMEKQLEAVSYQANVEKKRYFPGFFTVCAKRKA